jgi:hypothetical protein
MLSLIATLGISCGGDEKVGSLSLNLSLPQDWEDHLDMSVLSAPAGTPYIGTVRVTLDCAGDTRSWDVPWSDHEGAFGQQDLEKGCDIQVQAVTAGQVIMNKVQKNVVVSNGSDARLDIQLEEAGGFSFAGTLTHPRQYHSSVDLNGKILVLGGSLDTRSIEEVIYTGAGFSTAAFGCSLNEYRTMQKALYDQAGGRVFVFLGGTLDSLYEVVDVANEENTTRLLVTDRNEYYPNIYGQEIYLLGGKDTNESWIINSTKIESTSFDETMVSTMGITNEKQEVTCVSIDSSIVCLGGMIGTLYTDEIDHFDLEYEVARTPKALSEPKKLFSTTELPDGQLLVVGGVGASGLLSDIEILDLQNVQTTTFEEALINARVYHSATVLPNNKVLIIGGGVSANISNSAEIFDPLTGESVELPWRMRIPRNGHTATLLPDGRVLVVGGNPGDTTMEVFNPPVQ